MYLHLSIFLDSNYTRVNPDDMFTFYKNPEKPSYSDTNIVQSYLTLHKKLLFSLLIFLNLIPLAAASQDIEQNEEVLMRKAEYYIMIISDIIIMERFADKIKNPNLVDDNITNEFLNMNGYEISQHILAFIPRINEKSDLAKEYLTQLISERPKKTMATMSEVKLQAQSLYNPLKLRRILLDAQKLQASLKRQDKK